jgi:hypothetical protein
VALRDGLADSLVAGGAAIAPRHLRGGPEICRNTATPGVQVYRSGGEAKC